MGEGLHAVELSIPGWCGQLEGRLLFREATLAGTGAILCPPHPLLAGNMDNNVVQAVARAVAETMPMLLFNYPAVGRSASPRPDLPLFEVWNDLDQGRDYTSIIAEVRRVIGWSGRYFDRHHLIGYSFGACMALAALTGAALSYTAIAPPLAEEDFSLLPSLTVPVCLVTAAEEALLTPAEPLLAQPRVTVVRLLGADHFFRDQEIALARSVRNFLQCCLTEPIPNP